MTGTDTPALGGSVPGGAPRQSSGLVISKLTPPDLMAGVIDRPRVLRRFEGNERVVLVIAPPGYGKTVAARQWLDASELSTAWVAIDLLDKNGASFWRHLIGALRLKAPKIDPQLDVLVDQHAPDDPIFLGALIAEIERTPSLGAIVLDDLAAVTDRSVLDGIALLIDRVGHVVRFVITGRHDLALPTARWRSAGLLGDIREAHLRLTDDEATSIAQLEQPDLSESGIRALNERVEGWPTGLHLALLSMRDAPEPEAYAQRVVESDRLVADYLVTEVLDRLPDETRDVVLRLSVLDWFDADRCLELLGIDAMPAVHELRRSRLFIITVDGAAGAMRFHSLFRELLQNELRWRDPVALVRLHHRAAEMLQRRHDFEGAHRQLVAAGDLRAARRLIVPPAVEAVAADQELALTRPVRSGRDLVPIGDEAGPPDRSLGWPYAGSLRHVGDWCERAEIEIDPDDVGGRLRLHAARSMLSLARGDLEAAWTHIDTYDGLSRHRSDRTGIEHNLAITATQVALGTRRFGDARDWMARADVLDEADTVGQVTLTAFQSCWEWEIGDLRAATALASDACDVASDQGLHPNHGALEALIAAGMCRWSTGELVAAHELADQAARDAVVLGWPWTTLRTALLLAGTRRLLHGPTAALLVIHDARDRLGADISKPIADRLDASEASALIALGRYEAAQRLTARLPDSPRARLLQARLSVMTRRDGALDDLLSDRQGWTRAEQLEADILGTLGSGEKAGRRLEAVLVAARASGWVAPFLGQVQAVERLLDTLPVHELHPDLAAARTAQRPQPARARDGLVEHLTPREITVLELLPTHYSYAQIGQQLFLSVNTVKSNIKSLYRKLEVVSRSDAVQRATELGLL